MTETDIELRGRLIAQGYLLEIALGSLLSARPDRTELLARLRFDLHAQLRLDYSGTGPGIPSPDATPAVVSFASRCLDEHLDRLAGQFDNPAPPRHSA